MPLIFLSISSVFGSTVLSSVYGLDIASPENEYLLLADNVMRFMQKILTPGVYLVETFPWIQYIPAWVPGMGFKRNAVVWGRTLENFRDKPFQIAFDSVVSVLLNQCKQYQWAHASHQQSRGDSAPCVVEAVLNKISTQTRLEQEYELKLTKDVCGNVYLGAFTASQPMTSILIVNTPRSCHRDGKDPRAFHTFQLAD